MKKVYHQVNLKINKLKIGLQTWGSDGDINPFIALAGGLAERGHEVTLAVTAAERKDYGGYAQRLGFKLLEADHIGKDEEDLIRIAKQVHSENNPLKQLDLILETMFEPGVERMCAVSEALCHDNELVIGHFIVHTLQAVAEKIGRHYLTVTLNHSAIPSRYNHMMGFPNLGPFLNGLLWKLGHKVLNAHIIPHINRLRQRLNLPAARDYRQVWESRLANLIAVSPALCANWQDREPHQQVCGFFRIAEAGETFELPSDLENFIAAGTEPVYFTFGSMTAVDNGAEILRESTQLLIETAMLSGCRAIIQSRWDAVASLPEHPNIYRISEVPHTKIFPRCRAVVHHGGAGTTQTSLLHGIPSLVVPHITDQYFWARELKRLGVGAMAADRKQINAKQLATALQCLLADSSMRGNAMRIGKIMAKENGVATAVKVIEHVGR